VFRDGVPFKSGEAREGPLLGFDSPSEYCRGALPDAALAVFPPARADGSGPPLVGFLVPTALCSRVPVSAASGVTGRRRRGLPIPHPCRPRAFSAPRRVQPRRLEKTRFPEPTLDGARPETLRPCFMPQRPWDSPFRAFPSRRAVPPCGGLRAPLRVRRRPCPARRPGCVAIAFHRAPPTEPCGRPVRVYGATR